MYHRRRPELNIVRNTAGQPATQRGRLREDLRRREPVLRNGRVRGHAQSRRDGDGGPLDRYGKLVGQVPDDPSGGQDRSGGADSVRTRMIAPLTATTFGRIIACPLPTLLPSGEGRERAARRKAS